MDLRTDKTDNNKKAMVEALTKSLGIVSTACKSVNIARQTHYEWYKEDEAYRNDVDDVSEMAIDFVESKLFKLINEENPTAIIFFLKTKGKQRGYIEKSEVTHELKGSKNIEDWLRKDND